MTFAALVSAAALAQGNQCAGNLWTGASPHPITIDRYGFAQVGQDLYVISGFSEGGEVNTVRRYNATTNVWTALANIPVGSQGSAAAYFNGRIYVADGYDGGNLIRIYNIATNAWSAGPARPGVLESFGAAAGAFGGKVYVVGGPGSGYVPTTAVSIYNIATNSWSAGPAAPSPYMLGGYVQVGHFLYLIGSQTTDPSTNTAVSMRLDMTNNTWNTGPEWTPRRANFALAAAGSRLYAIGGDANGGGYFDPSAQVNELDTGAWPGGAWLPSPVNLPTPRYSNRAGFFSTGRTGGELWSTGGETSGFLRLNEHLFRPLECPVNYTTTGSITGSDTTQIGRIFRNGIASNCNGKAYPGTSDTTSGRHYDQYHFTNTNAAAACIQVTLSATISGIHSVAYLGGYDPANIQTNYLGDLGGYSANTTASYSFSVPAGATFFVIVHETNIPAPANTYTLSVGCTAVTTFAVSSNPTPIAIPDMGNANPYPSNITVSGAIGKLAAAPGSVRVTLNDLNHTFPNDLGMILLGPTGAAFEFLSGTSTQPASDITFSIGDSAPAPLPDNSALVNGTFYKPAVYQSRTYTVPAPTSFTRAAPIGTATFSSAFGGTDPNGTWSLYVKDFASGDLGSIEGGWELTIATNSPPLPLSAVSRKVHGGSPFNIPLPLTGTPGVECRNGGAGANHQVRITFADPVTVGGVCVTSSDGMANATRSVNNALVTVNLQNVVNAQTLTITLTEVSDGVHTGDVAIRMGVLAGDTTGNGSVNSSDIGQTKSKSGQAVTASNFRTDVTVSGSINSSDIGLVKSKSGTALP